MKFKGFADINRPQKMVAELFAAPNYLGIPGWIRKKELVEKQ